MVRLATAAIPVTWRRLARLAASSCCSSCCGPAGRDRHQLALPDATDNGAARYPHPRPGVHAALPRLRWWRSHNRPMCWLWSSGALVRRRIQTRQHRGRDDPALGATDF